MRVLFYLGDNEWSGCARATLVAARGLVTRGHFVTIACGAGTRLDRLAIEAGIDTVPISAGAWAASGSRELRKVLKDRFIEVAVVHAERDHLIVATAMRAAGRGAVLRRVPAFDSTDAIKTSKLALKLAASGVIVTTDEELRDLKATPGWSVAPVAAPLGVDAITYDAIQPALRSRMRAPERGLLVACAYDKSGRYRMGTVFRTLALLASRHGNMHVVVFGPGSTDDELRMHGAALGVGPIMSFLGERDDEHELMRAASAGWVIAGSDAAAFACLDFMALRIPVISERTPLTQHYVADGITGMLLAPGDPSYTASGLAGFFTAEDKRLAMGAAARSRVQREFAQSAMLDGFERAVNAAGDRTKWTKS